jgi:hypothetical protein
LWTKVRKDPSSMGSRFLETFAEGLEENSITNKRLSDELTLGKRSLGRSFLHEIILEAEDILEPAATANGYEWDYPTLTGTIGVTDYDVEKLDTLTDLLMAFPTRVSVASTVASGSRVIWQSSAPFTYGALPYPERLWVTVTDSSFFVNKTSKTDRDKSGYAAINIIGIDQDYNEFKEVLNLQDDGVFITASAFLEVTEIISEGFNGTVVITAGPVDLPYELDPYRVMVLDDLEGALKLVLTSGANSFLTYKADRFKLGRQYRRPGVDVMDNEEDLADLLLLDSDEEPYTALSMAISPNNTYLYVLDSTGRVHVYEHGLPEFAAPAANDTTTSYAELVAVRPYPKLGGTEYLWTRFERMRMPINFIQIKRVAPDATVTYLQPDKTTWANTLASISYPIQGKNSFEQWRDFRFSTVYDQTGPYEYSLTVKTDSDTTVYTTTVQCGALVANTSIATAIVSPTMLYFGENSLLTLDTGTTAYALNEHFDKYIIDERESHIWLSDNYDSVLVE